MCVAGQVECVSATTDFTVNSHYDIIQLVNVSGAVGAVLKNDNGDFVVKNIADAVFPITSLSYPTKVV